MELGAFLKPKQDAVYYIYEISHPRHRYCICALILSTYIIPGIEVQGLYAAIVAALFLGVMNAVARPILIFFTLPITILTLGVFIFVINAALFLFVASFVDGFAVASFWSALFGSLFVSIVSGLINKLG